MFKHISIVFKVTLLSSIWCSYAYATNLEEALTHTYNTNPELKAAQENLKATDEKIFQAIGGWLPTVKLNGEKSKQKGRYKWDPASPTVRSIKREFQVIQPLFNNGASLAEFKRASKEIEATRADFYNTEQNILLSAIEAYLNVLQAQEVLTLSKKNVEVVSKHLESTEERFKLGEATKTDVAQAKYKLSESVLGKTKAEGDYVAAKATYKKIIGVDADKLAMPQELTDLPKTVDDVLNAAKKANPYLIARRLGNDSAKYALLKSTESLLPTAYFTLTHSEQKPYQSITGKNLTGKNTTGTFNLSIPLYQGGREYSNIRATKYAERKSRSEAVNAENVVIETAVKAWEGMEVAKANIKYTADFVESASIALEGVKQEADVGTKTILDVLDTERDLFNAKVEQVKARRNLLYNIYYLKSVIGNLTAKSLALPTEIFDPVKHYNLTKIKLIGF
jgi:TolC family type I secretion outer membrane protein